jgi:Rrf2 family protein
MQILAIEEYGLRCLVQVAAHTGARGLTAPEIGRREGLGPEYVARIMATLRAGGLVIGTRGPGGGYRLARPAHQIAVWEAIQVLGGELFPLGFCDCHPGRRRECAHSADCGIRALWRRMQSTLRTALERISLEDLRRDERSMSDWLHSVSSPVVGPH